MGNGNYFLASRAVISPGGYCSFYIRICMIGNSNITGGTGADSAHAYTIGK